MNKSPLLSRRDFLARATLASSAAVLCGGAAFTVAGAPAPCPPLTVFSKVYQELKLDFAQAAELTAESGLDGVDCPVRPGGEILPERAVDDMPRYAEALRQRKAGLLLLTTAILSPSTPHAEEILRTAKKLGIRYYRIGQTVIKEGVSQAKLAGELKAQLKDLAPLNKEIGVCAMVQNHSPSGKSRYVGGDLNELYDIVKDFNPDQIGVAFDLGHALVVHGDEWPPLFEKIKGHLKVAYVKDAKKGARFTRFGEGDFKTTDWFTRLKAMNYSAPFSIHLEYDWHDKGKNKTRAALLAALKESAGMVREWVAKA